MNNVNQLTNNKNLLKKVKTLLFVLCSFFCYQKVHSYEITDHQKTFFAELDQKILITHLQKIEQNISKEDLQILLKSVKEEQTLFELSDIGYSLGMTLGMTFGLIFMAGSIAVYLGTYPNFFNPPLDAVDRRFFNKSIYFTEPVNEHFPWSYWNKD